MAADEAVAARGERLKVFISYSRADLDFADQLVLAVEDKGFEALVDRHDIDAAEKWQDRLGALIASSDTVVFVLSEQSAGSPICKWEVEEAARLNKRIIPVVPHDPSGVPPPPQLSELNYIHFFKHPTLPGSGFYDGVQKLDRALRVNLGWLRRQTALAEQAAIWEADKSDDRVLGGKPLEEALIWRASAPGGATVSPLILEYLAAGEEVAARRKAEADANIAQREAALKRARRATTFGGIVLILAGLAFVGAITSFYSYQRQREHTAVLQEENAELQIMGGEYRSLTELREHAENERRALLDILEGRGRNLTQMQIRRGWAAAANACAGPPEALYCFQAEPDASREQNERGQRWPALLAQTTDALQVELELLQTAKRQAMAAQLVVSGPPAPPPVCDPVSGTCRRQ